MHQRFLSLDSFVVLTVFIRLEEFWDKPGTSHSPRTLQPEVRPGDRAFEEESEAQVSGGSAALLRRPCAQGCRTRSRQAKGSHLPLK